MNPTPAIPSREARRVLIVRLSALGDVVNALPALTALRAMLPDAHIAWAVEPPCDQILQGHPMLDDLIVIPRRELAADLRSPMRWGAFKRSFDDLKRRLREKSYDAALDLQGNFRSGVVTWLTGARHRVGFARRGSKELSHLAYTHHVVLPIGKLHRVERGLKLLSCLGEVPLDPEPQVPTGSEARRFAKSFYEKNFAVDDTIAALHPGVSRFGVYKQWPEGRYAELADLLFDRHGVISLLTWGPGEREMCARIAMQADCTPVIGPETQSLKQLAALISRADLFIGADSGPARIAWAVGTPLVVIFGPKDPEIYGPTGERCRVVQRELPCRPCRRRTCPDPVCVTDIVAEEVVQAACEVLNNSQLR